MVAVRNPTDPIKEFKHKGKMKARLCQITVPLHLVKHSKLHLIFSVFWTGRRVKSLEWFWMLDGRGRNDKKMTVVSVVWHRISELSINSPHWSHTEMCNWSSSALTVIDCRVAITWLLTVDKSSGSQTGGRDPFVGRGLISRGRERVKQIKCHFFVNIINIFQHYK